MSQVFAVKELETVYNRILSQLFTNLNHNF
jgi:hypothetical protein